MQYDVAFDVYLSALNSFFAYKCAEDMCIAYINVIFPGCLNGEYEESFILFQLI